ncbi:MAG TPA: right-handed parallel beta-helix repeat-containing protein [Ktedonobacterales bacterium]|nr:right-handed parallel beta-helix repeat-containing protein [Ktedonobacterales bacterium]
MPAQATTFLTRTFVSSAGSDSNPCTITLPCQSFAHAYSLTLSSGIVTALDPGRYGPLIIGGPVTINGNGWASITAPAGGAGIQVNAALTDKVQLIGLNVDGAGAGYNGIVFIAGSSLDVTNCVLQNFVSDGSQTSGNGILLEPMSGTMSFTITNTTASNNRNAGIAYLPLSGAPSATGVIDHVVATRNGGGGIIVLTDLPAAGGSAFVSISNSIVSNNSGNTVGMAFSNASGAPMLVSIDNTSITGNFAGINALNNSKVILGRSVITGNNQGVINQTSPNTFYTYKDNRISGNTSGADIQGALNATVALQ